MGKERLRKGNNGSWTNSGPIKDERIKREKKPKGRGKGRSLDSMKIGEGIYILECGTRFFRKSNRGGQAKNEG